MKEHKVSISTSYIPLELGSLDSKCKSLGRLQELFLLLYQCVNYFDLNPLSLVQHSWHHCYSFDLFYAVFEHLLYLCDTYSSYSFISYLLRPLEISSGWSICRYRSIKLEFMASDCCTGLMLGCFVRASF